MPRNPAAPSVFVTRHDVNKDNPDFYHVRFRCPWCRRHHWHGMHKDEAITHRTPHCDKAPESGYYLILGTHAVSLWTSEG